VDVYSGASANAAQLVQTFDLNFPPGNFPIPTLVNTGTTTFRGANATTPDFWWTFANRYSGVRNCPHAPGAEYYDSKRRFAATTGTPGFKDGGVFRQEDVVRSIVPDHGDIRLIAAQKQIGTDQFVRVRADKWEDPDSKFLHIFQAVTGSHHHFGFSNEPGPSPAAGIPAAAADDQLYGSAAVSLHYSRLPEIRPGAGKLYNRWGDFDNSVATWTDGAYINKPDEGNLSSSNSPYTYFSWSFSAPTDTNFSPNRLIPSAGMLGSLPTGVKRHSTTNPHAWETLLFRPQAGHPGEQLKPKDHLIMDLFWMPVGEPYPISEPFSTAGKINLNYEIAPFSYIRRATAVHGVLKAEEPLALINAASKGFKLWDHESNDWPSLPNSANDQDPQLITLWNNLYNGVAPFDKMRRPIDPAQTLLQADTRFTAGDIFRSASQICELHLVRQGESLSQYTANSIWPNAVITGDNTRERPYTNLYAKLTTKSNTFNVHMRVQVLRKRPGTTDSDYAVWNESSDSIVAEHRGSALVERYIDASDPNLPDFATNSNATLDNYARFRILSTSKFAP
jgi:uncharacterized protein (TIGR02600 family)